MPLGTPQYLQPIRDAEVVCECGEMLCLLGKKSFGLRELHSGMSFQQARRDNS